MKKAKILLCFLLPFSAVAEPIDRVDMKNGDVYRGTILEQRFGEFIQIRFSDGNEKRLDFNEISQIKKEETAPTPTPSLTPTPVPAPVAAPVEVSEEKWSKKLIFSWGWSFTPSTSETVKSTTGTVLATADTKGLGSAQYEIGLDFRNESKNFGIDLYFAFSKYAYSDGSTPDTNIGFFVLPKAYLGGGPIKAWLGAGIGENLTIIGTPTLVSDGVTLESDKSVLVVPVTARAGIEITPENRTTYGIQAGYIVGAASLEATVTGNGNTVKLVNDFVRSNWFLLLTVGIPVN